MRDVILGMSLALDGFVAGPNDENDWIFQCEDGKPIRVAGGATFAQPLVRANLVDEYQLAVHPIALAPARRCSRRSSSASRSSWWT